MQSAKSKASKPSKQAKIFTTKSVKSRNGKSEKSGKGSNVLFHKSSDGHGWWSGSSQVSYQQAGSDYSPIGLEGKSLALCNYGLGSWTVVVTLVGLVGSLLWAY